ncbi:LOW QUALITY PROTEIN: hypothetical protein OSB04_006371 [Centaurea solstitialis]|uniref:Uncharacterized protein n=1 Tax=Centaurea solstitialis TaxID=347529 RepID=A0AA38TVL8_9ASTR|nr:LOW QUALITY PROTEIN: hypothetical protein OSB04_006371 [Centaurea solstitialis]
MPTHLFTHQPEMEKQLYGVSWLKPYAEEAVESKWPAGFYFEAQLSASQSQSSDQHMLDLNLKL